MSFQKYLVRGLMRLPKSWLLKMAGGTPLVIDGRTMDVRCQLLAAQGAKAPSMTSMTPVEARKAAGDGLAMLDAKPRRKVAIRSATVPGPAGPLNVRIYTPPGATKPLPGIVWYHMGGCVIGDLETSNTFCSVLAEEANCVVVSVDYRLAPEHVFPAAVDDAIAAYEHVTRNALLYGMDEKVIGVGGDSAGGYLSAVIAQEMKRKGGQQPAVQLLVYPATDWGAEGGSMESCGEVYPLTHEIMDWFATQYLPDESQRTDLRVSPALSDDVSGLAPAVIATAGFDVLRDQGHAYGRQLEIAGVPVTVRCYHTLPHAFTAMGGVVPEAARACIEIAADVKQVLHRMA